MGIKNLNKFLRATCPEVFEEIHLSEFAFKRIAIDTSLYMCSYKAIYGEDGWLRAFVNLVACLRKNEVHCIFIYDGIATADKDVEKKRRSEQRDKLSQRIYDLEEAVRLYHSTGEVSPLLIEFQKKRKIAQPRLLSKTPQITIDIQSIEYHLGKMQKQSFSVTKEDFIKTRELFKILDVPFFQAELEAETVCADLCKRELVDAVLSEDTDVMAYACPIFLTKINTNTSTCFRIDYNNVLSKLGLSSESFLDFCIMCGTDYNDNIFRVGPTKAYAYISRYENIEGVSSVINVDILKYERVRELFRSYEGAKIGKIPYCGFPDFPKLALFATEHNIKTDISSLKKSFINEIVIEEDDT